MSNEPTVLDVSRGLKVAAVAGMGAFFQVGAALAAEELEIAELPPPYVPALFGVLLIVGVGVLTSSLGDVYTEGMYGYHIGNTHFLESYNVVLTNSTSFVLLQSLR